MSDLLRILAVVGLVAGNAFFVIGEYSVVTARRAALAGRDSAGARAALRLMDDPVRVISTVQVGITAIGILTGALAEPVVRGLIGDAIPSWLTFVLAFATVTYTRWAAAASTGSPASCMCTTSSRRFVATTRA